MLEDQRRWKRWSCPHPDCADDSREYKDPETVEKTMCANEHIVRLIWSDDGVRPKLVEEQDAEC
jgi:hypothetical protein